MSGRQLFDLLPAILRIRDRARAVPTPGWLEPAARDRYVELRAKLASGTLTALEREELDRLTEQAQAGPLASFAGLVAEPIAAPITSPCHAGGLRELASSRKDGYRDGTVGAADILLPPRGRPVDARTV